MAEAFTIVASAAIATFDLLTIALWTTIPRNGYYRSY